MENMQKTRLFEETPVPKAVMALAIPTVISSLVMVIYNLADTYFVGMMSFMLTLLVSVLYAVFKNKIKSIANNSKSI